MMRNHTNSGSGVRPAQATRLWTWAILGIGISFLLAMMDSAPAHAAVYPGSGPQTSPIWAPGTSWSAAVLQRDAVNPDPTGGTIRTVFRMRVASAPSSPSGLWVVKANMDHAQGPFADGFTLYYVKQRDGMVLDRVGFGGQYPVPASHARLMVGQNFPLQFRISSPPTGYTIDLR